MARFFFTLNPSNPLHINVTQTMMSPEEKAISIADFPLALFMLGLPLMLAAYNISGIVAPGNLSDILATGLAIAGLLAELFKSDRHPVLPAWITAGIPGLLITWILFNSFQPLTIPLTEFLPYLLEARPLLYLLVTFLWTSRFSSPSPEQISFWASWLALLVCAELAFSFLWVGLAIEPGIFGHYSLTGPALLCGLCATLHSGRGGRLHCFIILTGIFCTLSRDYGFAALAVMFLFGSHGFLKKTLLVLALLFFSYLSLLPQNMSFIAHTDLPLYWVWFSVLELLARTPAIMLTGFPLDVPLPLAVPASLWNIWHEQHYVWTAQGIFLFHLTPFWLHLITAWGLGGIFSITAGSSFLYRRYRSAMLGGLIAGVAISGFFSPLFYSAPSAIVLSMTLISCTRPELQTFKFE